jgi:hypothetical protein
MLFQNDSQSLSSVRPNDNPTEGLRVQINKLQQFLGKVF